MTGVGTLAWLVTRVIANPDIAASDDSNHYFDWDTDWRHVVFWVANLGVAPLWILGVVAPRSSLTHGIWTSPFVALPWTLAFSVGLIVSSCLPWWLNLWLDGQLSLPHLIHQLGSDPGSMLLIWLYILGFDGECCVVCVLCLLQILKDGNAASSSNSSVYSYGIVVAVVVVVAVYY